MRRPGGALYGPLRTGQTLLGLTLAGLSADAHAQQASDLVIRNGLVVTSTGRTRADILVHNGTIAEISPELAAPGAREIDAKGLLVLPGGVDPHVHLVPATVPGRGADDYTTASRAAFAGGKTGQRTGSPSPDVAAPMTAAVSVTPGAIVSTSVGSSLPQSVRSPNGSYDHWYECREAA